MIRGCIFDLGGTIVDRYSLTPFLSLKKAFSKQKIIVPNKLIFQDMGISKKDHVRNIINNRSITSQWLDINNEYPDEIDINNIYDNFNKIQLNYSENLMTILPETPTCIEKLRDQGIKLGVTTGFNKENMTIIKNKLDRNKIHIDHYVSSTCLNLPSRPLPYMIEKNMDRMDITNPRYIIKVDDSQVGIEEGKNANCWTVGVSRWSTNIGIHNIDDAFSLEDKDLYNEIINSRKALNNADFVIDTLDELPNLIENINLNLL